MAAFVLLVRARVAQHREAQKAVAGPERPRRSRDHTCQLKVGVQASACIKRGLKAALRG